jgi:predicted heme/steroid binding protein
MLIFLGLFYLIRKYTNGGDLPKMGRKELNEYDGTKLIKVYIGVKDNIFDVTGSEHYCKGGSYELFAGRDISLASAKYKTDPELLDKDLPADLTEKELKCLDSFNDFYLKKYPLVGKLDLSRDKED